MRTRDEAIVWAMTATALGGYSIGAGMIAWPCAIVVLCVNAIAHRRRRDP
jgi:Trk-type K+ transport system membrane component